ncbi:DUF2238 domain-containing protein [Pontibacter vulgaris]|uniref:DUF2238 domain-containing protein n=1 Tax=Pontibacter vulgaris TaxID=2905679 RepID=UPI001FA7E3A1|nr:DUF2238 domain-containing protein [Pontibacter vulgaris]
MNVTTLAKPEARVPFLHQPLHVIYTVAFFAFWVYTGITTTDLINWLLENTLTLSLIIFVVAFYNIFRFSDTSYTLILLFLLLHVYGSQYQYAGNPFGEWLKLSYGLGRNQYDRFVHFGFGLLLAYPMHEVLARGFRLSRFLALLMPLEIILSMSALYELLEWVVADMFFNEDKHALAYLGTQGDVWDAQKDVALAFLGAFLAIATTSAILKLSRR